MRVRIAVLMVAACAAPVFADEDGVKKAAFRLTTAYQCAPMTGNHEAYEWAKADAVKLVGYEKAAEIVAAVEAQGTEGSTLSKALCETFTQGFHD